ncbi:hypothetical protein GM672_13225, partial [Massilia buxea]|nr:hypothetical protein [Pseudoduganella buxea]
MPISLPRLSPAAHPKNGLRLIPLLLAVAVSQAYAEPVRGAPGTPGTDGTTPGAPGTAGGAAPGLTLAGDATHQNTEDGRSFDLSGFGGTGGAGGNGAPGGAAGAGGNGADVNVRVTGNPAWFETMVVGTRAFGGAGGSTGTAGTGGPLALGGAGGNGTAITDVGTTSPYAGLLVTTEGRGGAGGAGGGAGGNGSAHLTVRG